MFQAHIKLTTTKFFLYIIKKNIFPFSSSHYRFYNVDKNVYTLTLTPTTRIRYPCLKKRKENKSILEQEKKIL